MFSKVILKILLGILKKKGLVKDNVLKTVLEIIVFTLYSTSISKKNNF